MSKRSSGSKKVLVIGAYGLIGQAIANRLIAEGHQVVGLGRNLKVAKRVLPNIPWLHHDLKDLVEAASWQEFLGEFSTVVNCSGALQDGPNDTLEVLHHNVVLELAQACVAEDITLIQISAVGAKPEASTQFLASKGRGDKAIRDAGGKWYIFRPGLVLASNAYGGTIVLRMLAAFPWVQPIALPEAQIQTVSLDDVANAVAAATNGTIPNQFEADLVELKPHSLREIVNQMRRWLGFAEAKFELTIPSFGVAVVSKLADVLAWLGWRSPLRSTAMRVLVEGVQGQPEDLRRYNLPQTQPLSQTLANMNVGVQDRLFARMSLLAPFVIACLSMFWIVSGLIGIFKVEEAAQVLQNVGWSMELAIVSVVFWGVIDIFIGIGLALRKYAQAACLASVAVSLFYLVASTLTVPELWIDPLGPLVKVVPAIVLTIVARVLLEAR